MPLRGGRGWASVARVGPADFRPGQVGRAIPGVELRIAEPATRQSIRRAYFERLVRSDLGVALDDALKRREPAIDEASPKASAPPSLGVGPSAENAL